MQIICQETTGKPRELTMTMPFDGHEHLRMGAMQRLVAPMVAKRFYSAIIMPNPHKDFPITTPERLHIYRREILQTVPQFWPLMTMYLTDQLKPADVDHLASTGMLFGIKYYPRGLTTNSDNGVENPESLWTPGTMPYQVLRILAQHGIPLLLHAADGFARKACKINGRTYAPGEELDPYDQEIHFIDFTLPEIVAAHPDLKISVEHLSTANGVVFLRKYGNDKLGCSLTAIPLLLDRRDVFRGGFRPNKSWWPILQPKEHSDEIRKFGSEGHQFAWLGNDSAPHTIDKKYADCCMGGVLTAHVGIELYAEAFENMGCLDKLEAFACFNGPRFFGIEPSTKQIRLVREEWTVRDPFFCLEEDDTASPPSNDKMVVPFRLGEKMQWKLAA